MVALQMLDRKRLEDGNASLKSRIDAWMYSSGMKNAGLKA